MPMLTVVPFKINDPAVSPSLSPSVPCCMCGVPIVWNQKAMCVTCAQSRVNITEDISKEGVISACRTCGRYMDSPKQWVLCSSESDELLAICLKRLKGLNRVKIIDASFVWTEPTSKRLQVQLTVEDEPYTNLVLQQDLQATLAVNSTQCPSCQKSSRLVSQNISWTAVVQVRQKVAHKQTFFLLEQLILKHQAHSQIVRVSDSPDGLDFFFMERRHAMKFSEFLMPLLPARKTTGGSCNTKVLSEDIKNNEAMIKHALCIEIAPVCKHDLVCLHPRQYAACGTIGPIVLVTSVNSSIHLLDVTRMRIGEMKSDIFFHNPRDSIMTMSKAVEYVVLDVEETGLVNGPFHQGEVTLARSSDLGVNDKSVVTLTHLAGSLEAGDVVLGYDLTSAVYNAACTKEWPEKKLLMPEVVVIKKVASSPRGMRNWKLKTLIRSTPTKASASSPKMKQSQQDFERFLDEVESDWWVRQSINIYKDPDFWRLDEHGVARSKDSGSVTDSSSDDSGSECGVPPTVMLSNLLMGEEDKEAVGRNTISPVPDSEG